MGTVFAIIFIVGASAFCIWSIIGLIGAIKDRRAKKLGQSSEGEAVDDNTADTGGERK